jgi:hypothetical protein
MATNSRYPVIALDYAEKHKAVKKELLVDYNTGNIYVVSATDKTIIFDITKKIQEQITELAELDTENMVVEITGIGIVNLTEYLNLLNEKMNNMVTIKDPGQDFAYIIRDNTIDNKSLKIFNGIIQMDSYKAADNLSIPQKTSTGLRWMPVEELVQNISRNESDNGDGYSAVDGNLKKVPLLVNDNNKIYLNSHAQKSYNLTGNFANVYLPTTVDEYSIIKWEIMQPQQNIILILESSVYINTKMLDEFIPMIAIEYEKPNFVVTINKTEVSNTKYLFIFQTFDYGKSWMLNIEIFRNENVLN